MSDIFFDKDTPIPDYGDYMPEQDAPIPDYGDYMPEPCISDVDLYSDFRITFWVRRNTWWLNWKQYTPPYTPWQDRIEVKSDTNKIFVPPEVGNDWTHVTIRRG